MVRRTKKVPFIISDRVQSTREPRTGRVGVVIGVRPETQKVLVKFDGGLAGLVDNGRLELVSD